MPIPKIELEMKLSDESLEKLGKAIAKAYASAAGGKPAAADKPKPKAAAPEPEDDAGDDNVDGDEGDAGDGGDEGDAGDAGDEFDDAGDGDGEEAKVYTKADVSAALKAVKDLSDHNTAMALLKKVSGAAGMTVLPEDKYGVVVEAANKRAAALKAAKAKKK